MELELEMLNLIVPDQKVTAGAMNEVVKSFRILLGTGGGVYL